MREFFWSHSLSEIIQPLLQRGIQILHFQEFPFSPYNAFPNMVEVRPGEWIPQSFAEGMIPMMFSLLGQMKA